MGSHQNMVVFIAAFAFFTTGYIWSKTPLEKEWGDSHKTTVALQLPVPESLAASALNFRTFAADVAWVRSLVGRGEDVRKKRTNGFYLSNGRSLTGVDPFFRRAYDLFPSISLQASEQVSHEKLMDIADFYDRGIETFSTDPKLTYDAGLLFVGYSTKHSDEDRAIQTKRALSYFKKTADLPGANSLTSGLISFFTRRAQKETGGEEAWGLADRDLLLQLYMQTPDENFKKYLEGQLSNIGVDATTFQQSARLREKTISEMKKEDRLLYLNHGMFWTVAK